MSSADIFIQHAKPVFCCFVLFCIVVVIDGDDDDDDDVLVLLFFHIQFSLASAACF